MSVAPRGAVVSAAAAGVSVAVAVVAPVAAADVFDDRFSGKRDDGKNLKIQNP